MGVLDGTCCYLVGAMDRTQSGSAWRIDAIERFQPYGVRCFNPYDKPIDRGGEDIDQVELREKYIKEEKWDEVAKIMKEVVAIDLRMVDLSDFIVAYIDMDQKPCGAIWELVVANNEKKPIVVIIPGGKKNAPRWLFGVIPHKFYFSSLDEAFEYISEVDKGLHQDERWKIFRYKRKF